MIGVKKNAAISFSVLTIDLDRKDAKIFYWLP